MAQRTRHGRPSDKGQRGGCPAIGLLWARYRRAKCLLSGGFSTVTAIFPARIFKILCGFFRPEFSYIFFTARGARASRGPPSASVAR